MKATVARKTAAAVPSSGLNVPASLHASLMARLDRLGPAKEVAQIGAAMGREFSHALLLRWFVNLKRSLDRRWVVSPPLVCSFDGVFRRRQLYLFKHALAQDAAYGTLLREPRRALHARIAETLGKPKFAEMLPKISRRFWRVTLPRLE